MYIEKVKIWAEYWDIITNLVKDNINAGITTVLTNENEGEISATGVSYNINTDHQLAAIWRLINETHDHASPHHQWQTGQLKAAFQSIFHSGISTSENYGACRQVRCGFGIQSGVGRGLRQCRG
jgi:hypothetical protein